MHLTLFFRDIERLQVEFLAIGELKLDTDHVVSVDNRCALTDSGNSTCVFEQDTVIEIIRLAVRIP